MGSASAAGSVDRVLDTHGGRIRKELLADYARPGPDGRKLVRDVLLTNDAYEIGVTAVLENGQELTLRGISIDDLVDEFPDCDVGY